MVVFQAIIVGVVGQIIIAIYTAQDANKRGHDDTWWFMIVMLFGIFGVVIYLLKRNHKRLPDSEVPSSNLNFVLSRLGIYSGSAILGILIAGILASPSDGRSLTIGLVFPPIAIYLERKFQIINPYIKYIMQKFLLLIYK